MSRFVAIFRDAVDPAAVSAAISDAHFAYLRDHSGSILLAGGLRRDLQQPFCGALWILDCANKADAEELIENDPYRANGIWSKPEVFAWGKAPFYGTIEL